MMQFYRTTRGHMRADIYTDAQYQAHLLIVPHGDCCRLTMTQGARVEVDPITYRDETAAHFKWGVRFERERTA